MLSIAEQSRATHVVGRLNHLLAADSVWMSGVGRRQADEVEALGIVRDQLLATLTTLRGDVGFVREVAAGTDPEPSGVRWRTRRSRTRSWRRSGR